MHTDLQAYRPRRGFLRHCKEILGWRWLLFDEYMHSYHHWDCLHSVLLDHVPNALSNYSVFTQMDIQASPTPNHRSSIVRSLFVDICFPTLVCSLSSPLFAQGPEHLCNHIILRCHLHRNHLRIHYCRGHLFLLQHCLRYLEGVSWAWRSLSWPFTLYQWRLCYS